MTLAGQTSGTEGGQRVPGRSGDKPMPAHLCIEVKQASKNSLPPRCQEQQAFDKQSKNNLCGKDISAPSIGVWFVLEPMFAFPSSCQLTWCLLLAHAGPGWHAGDHEGPVRCYVLLLWQGFGLPGSGEAASRDVPGRGYKVLLVLWLPSCLQTQGQGLCGCHHAVEKGQGGLLQETGARSAAVAPSVLMSPSHKWGQ